MHYNHDVLAKQFADFNIEILNNLNFDVAIIDREKASNCKGMLDDMGGFQHSDLSGIYTKYQSDIRFKNTRLYGYAGLFALAIKTSPYEDFNSSQFVLDFLAGSGTLSKRMKQLVPELKRPKVFGLDVSPNMCKVGQEQSEIVFWGKYDDHPFQDERADFAIASYGFHHVPVEERQGFAQSMSRALKPGGVCILHDFEEKSPSARFYSELIHKYRKYGHDFEHFTKASMLGLFNSGFTNVDVEYVYDPFYLESKENQSEKDLLREFFAYIICLFNLSKLLPSGVGFDELFSFDSDEYWEGVGNIISQYVSLEVDEFKSLKGNYDETSSEILSFYETKVPLVDRITINKISDKKLSLTAPRIALVGIGRK